MSRPDWESRDPVYRPSAPAERSIRESERRRRAAADRTLHLIMAMAAVIFGVLLIAGSGWALLRRFALLTTMAIAMVGCVSPAADYVHAEAAAWAQIDDRLDGWIDGEATYSPEKKDALHQLNAARRARVAHAIAAVGS